MTESTERAVDCPDCNAPNAASASVCLACGHVFDPTKPRIGPGYVLADRYEILTQLGQGGMGIVYQAHDRTLDEIVAIKVLRPDVAHRPDLAQRFRSEIKLARRIRHRNVCSIYGDGEDCGLVYICMELVAGVDMRRSIREEGMRAPDDAFEIAIQAAEGLQAIHDVGIVHRDLKTANIMRDARGHVRLMDFGVAKIWRPEGSADLTLSGQLVGTPDYMSPEQARGEAATFQSDIYGLGIVAFELFTGRLPFKGDTPLATLQMHLHDAPPFEGHAGQLPATVQPVLRKALAKEPRDRYSSAEQMAEALRRARDSCAFDGGTTSTWARPEDSRRGARLAALAARPRVRVTIFALVAGALLYRFAIRDPPSPAVATGASPNGVASSPPAASANPPIAHAPIRCFVAASHPVVDAAVPPGVDVSAPRVYFRSELSPSYYYVPMALTDGRLEAVLPRPKLGADFINYYIQVEVGGQRLRTQEYNGSLVADETECPAGQRVAENRPKARVTVYTDGRASAVMDLGFLRRSLGIDGFMQGLKDPDAEVRVTAAESLTRMAPTVNTVMVPMARDLEGSDAVERARALRRLHAMAVSPAWQDVSDALLRALSDDAPRVRTRAAEAIASIGPPVASASSALSRALKDENPEIRQFASEALARIGSSLASVIAALDACRTDKEPLVRDAALKALGNIRDARK